MDGGAGIRIEEARQRTPELVDAVAALVAELSRSASPPEAAHVGRIVESDACRLLIARDAEDRAVGMLTLVVFPIPTGVRAWIEDVVVTASARGHGVGALLTREAVRIAGEEGARTVDLTSRPDREAANRLYARLGFERRETERVPPQRAVRVPESQLPGDRAPRTGELARRAAAGRAPRANRGRVRG